MNKTIVTSRTSLVVLIASLWVSGLLAGCRSPATEPDQVSVRLKWFHQTQFAGEDPIGWMRADTWQYMHDILLEQGFVADAIDVTTVYTNEFVEKTW